MSCRNTAYRRRYGKLGHEWPEPRNRQLPQLVRASEAVNDNRESALSRFVRRVFTATIGMAMLVIALIAGLLVYINWYTNLPVVSEDMEGKCAIVTRMIDDVRVGGPCETGVSGRYVYAGRRSKESLAQTYDVFSAQLPPR